MASQFQQEGRLIDFTAGGSAVAACGVVVGTDRCFVAPLAIPANTLGSLATTGVCQLPKATGTAWTFGQKLYWDASGSNVVTTTNSGANKVIGYAAAAAASGAVEGQVLLGT